MNTPQRKIEPLLASNRGYKSVVTGEEGTFIEVIGPHHHEDATAIAALPELIKALKTIKDAEYYDGDAVVCDFYTLQSVASHALSLLEGAAA